MPFVVLAAMALTALPGLWLGGRNLARWEDVRDPAVFRDVVGHITVVALRLGLLVLLVALATVAVVGSLAAIKGDAPVPRGCIVAAVVAVLISALVYGSFGRRVTPAVRARWR